MRPFTPEYTTHYTTPFPSVRLKAQRLHTTILNCYLELLAGCADLIDECVINTIDTASLFQSDCMSDPPSDSDDNATLSLSSSHNEETPKDVD
eukprot:1294287-Rhodomonas_salina.1